MSQNSNIKVEKVPEKPSYPAYQIDKDLELLSEGIVVLSKVVDQRMRMISTTSALSATLLTVATFNPELLPLNDFIRLLLVILLLIIPASLLVNVWYFRNQELTWMKSINDVADKYDLKDRNRLQKLPPKYDLAFLFACIISIVVFIIAAVIFPAKNFWSIYSFVALYIFNFITSFP